LAAERGAMPTDTANPERQLPRPKEIKNTFFSLN